MLTIAYDGTDFCGWQKQGPGSAAVEEGASEAMGPAPGVGEAPDMPAPLRTVQGVVERAVREAVREPVQLMGASRTDSGVHARMQVAAFTRREPGDDRQGPPDERLAPAINARLPEDVQVLSCREVHPRFDPIGHAEAKGYRYTLHTGAMPPLWNRRYVHHLHHSGGGGGGGRGLDIPAMRGAARALVGEHDFAAFAAAGHGRLSTVRTVFACDILELDAETIAIDISGNGFLWNMVRIIAGTLAEVGRARRTPESVSSALASLDRRNAGPTLPPTGLCLMWIKYPDAVYDTTGAAALHERRAPATDGEPHA